MQTELAWEMLELALHNKQEREEKYSNMFPRIGAYLVILRSQGSLETVGRNSIIVDGGGRHIDLHLAHCPEEL